MPRSASFPFWTVAEARPCSPKLPADETFREFIIRHEIDKGLPGFINLVGIETPGVTASPAVARYVSGMLEDILKN